MLGVEAEAEFHFSAVVGHCKPVLSILQAICVKTYFMHKTLSHQFLLQQAVSSGQRHICIYANRSYCVISEAMSMRGSNLMSWSVQANLEMQCEKFSKSFY